MEGLSNMTNGLQARADRLDSARPTGRFHSKTSLDESGSPDPVVYRAVARAKEGDPEAVRFLYLRYADNVYSYVRSIVRDEHEAEDVTQHVFAKLITVIGKYEQRQVPFAAWILRVARNVALDHVRQRRPIPCEEVREHDVNETDETANQRSLMLRDALATLPDDQREVIVLRHVVGLTPGEIAGRLGRTEPSIHGLHHRGRGALRSTLRQMECGPTVRGRVAA
jgi:RNA polymerase sigma-70 factor (ECF subfamily)